MTTASHRAPEVPAGGVFSAGGKVMVKGAGVRSGGSAEGKTDFVFDIDNDFGTALRAQTAEIIDGGKARKKSATPASA